MGMQAPNTACPVLARASFGIQGAHIPSLLRALVACGWFGIQTWFGGFAIYQLLNALPVMRCDELPVLGIIAEFACFILFWVMQIAIIYRGVESIPILETLAAPFLIAIGLNCWPGPTSRLAAFRPCWRCLAFDPGGEREGEFMSVFVPSLTAMVGFWATLSLNIPDFTRYAKSQRDQVLGQAIGLPTTMTLFAFISVAVTSATTVIFKDPTTGALHEPVYPRSWRA